MIPALVAEHMPYLDGILRTPAFVGLSGVSRLVHRSAVRGAALPAGSLLCRSNCIDSTGHCRCDLRPDCPDFILEYHVQLLDGADSIPGFPDLNMSPSSPRRAC